MQILENYAKEVPIAGEGIRSYDYYIEHLLPKLFASINVEAKAIVAYKGAETIEKMCKISFQNVNVRKPMIIEGDGRCKEIFPGECRLRKLSYGISLYTDVHVKRGSGKFTILKDVYMGMVPCMVGSKFCHLYEMNKNKLVEHGEDPYDPQSYFIVSGTERSIINQVSSSCCLFFVFANSVLFTFFFFIA